MPANPVPPEPRPAAPPAVVVTDLVKRFGDFVAVNKVSFRVAAGEVFGFLGPNGAGKSTTIRILCGLLTPSSGSGSVAGYDITREPEQIKAHIGYMSQKFSLYDDLSVIQNIDFFAGIYRLPRAKRKEREEWVIEMAGLKDHRQALTASLSAGWKQRLALGCAVLHEPPVLFLDEPTSGVDPMSRRQFWELIYELAGRGVTVFVTTHYMDEAEYCDRLALIYRGQIVALGTPSALKAEHMSDQVIEVLCQRPQDALDPVAALPGVREVALYGRGLHVVAADAAALIPALIACLTQAGCAPARVEQITPGLEDVFVSLIEAHDRAHAALPEVRT